MDKVELSQHSIRVLNFIRSLEKFSKESNGQVLITTHHYNAVDFSHSIKRLKLNKGDATEIIEIELDEKEKKIFRKYTILRELLFLRKAIFVEGENDWFAANELISKPGIYILMDNYSKN